MIWTAGCRITMGDPTNLDPLHRNETRQTSQSHSMQIFPLGSPQAFEGFSLGSLINPQKLNKRQRTMMFGQCVNFPPDRCIVSWLLIIQNSQKSIQKVSITKSSIEVCTIIWKTVVLKVSREIYTIVRKTLTGNMHSWERPSLADLGPSSKRLPRGKPSTSRCGNLHNTYDHVGDHGDHD